MMVVSNEFVLSASTLPGKPYAVAAASSVTGTWTQVGMSWIGDGREKNTAIPPDETRQFFRIEMGP